MKITKERIRQLIKEEMKNLPEQDEAEPSRSQRVGRVSRDLEGGGTMDAKEYLDLITQTLGTTSATDQHKIEALDALFNNKGREMMGMFKKFMLQGAKK